MPLDRRTVALLHLSLVCALSVGLAQAPLAPAVGLTPQQMEAFLLNARIVAQKVTQKGTTKPIQATLSDGKLTHDAQIQTIDESRAIFEAGKASEVGFRDTYKFNIAAYRLSRILGLRNVPMSVERRVNGKPAALTWWLDDVRMDESDRIKLKPAGANLERVSKYMHVMRAWDELIQNRDRNQGNIIWSSDWTLWMIDHTRAFRTGDSLLKPDQLTRCDRAFLDAMRRLSAADMEQVAAGGFLTRNEATAVLKRRDRLVKHFDDRVAANGEAVVLFTLES